MARKHQLRDQRSGTVINTTSRKQESDIVRALAIVLERLQLKFGERLRISHAADWKLRQIVGELRKAFPDTDFHCHFDTSSIRPDGGILFLEPLGVTGLCYPILISEVKNQGTNDLRAAEGLPKQSKGNAIERLGKNVIGLRTALLRESIFPFVCFGYGCDFAADSSILDRVTTIAMFGRLNETYLHSCEGGRICRGSFYFRESKWTVDEMASVMADIAERSVQYYFSKYGESTFRIGK